MQRVIIGVTAGAAVAAGRIVYFEYKQHQHDQRMDKYWQLRKQDELKTFAESKRRLTDQLSNAHTVLQHDQLNHLQAMQKLENARDKWMVSTCEYDQIMSDKKRVEASIQAAAQIEQDALEEYKIEVEKEIKSACQHAEESERQRLSQAIELQTSESKARQLQIQQKFEDMQTGRFQQLENAMLTAKKL
jgi:hypothetical protein